MFREVRLEGDAPNEVLTLSLRCTMEHDFSPVKINTRYTNRGGLFRRSIVCTVGAVAPFAAFSSTRTTPLVSGNTPATVPAANERVTLPLARSTR